MICTTLTWSSPLRAHVTLLQCSDDEHTVL